MRKGAIIATGGENQRVRKRDFQVTQNGGAEAKVPQNGLIESGVDPKCRHEEGG